MGLNIDPNIAAEAEIAGPNGKPNGKRRKKNGNGKQSVGFDFSGEFGADGYTAGPGFEYRRLAPGEVGTGPDKVIQVRTPDGFISYLTEAEMATKLASAANAAPPPRQAGALEIRRSDGTLWLRNPDGSFQRGVNTYKRDPTGEWTWIAYGPTGNVTSKCRGSFLCGPPIDVIDPKGVRNQTIAKNLGMLAGIGAAAAAVGGFAFWPVLGGIIVGRTVGGLLVKPNRNL